MRHVRKLTELIVVLLLAALTAGTLSSCTFPFGGDKKTDDEEGLMVYYLNATMNDIEYRRVKLQEDVHVDSLQMVDFLLTQMFETDYSQEQLFSAKPEGVEIVNRIIADNVLTLDFNDAYLNLTNVEEILLRASLVLTMIQVPEVTSVVFTVNGMPLTDSNGKEIGAMNASNFVNILLNEEGMLKQETDLTIYFTDETGTKLIPSKAHFTISNSNSSMEEYIVQQIKTGPDPNKEGLYRTMDPDVEILSVVTSDDVCYVNLGSNFLEQEQPVGDDILIYSIVNSLCLLDYVSSVQFLINGSSDVKLHTVVDLNEPKVPKKELVS